MACKILDIKKDKKLIENLIKKYATLPEQNYYNLFYHNDSSAILIDKKYLVLFYEIDKKWRFISEPLGKNKLSILNKAIKFAFIHTNKITFELTENLAKKIIKKYKVKKIIYTYHWPVYNLKKFDPDLKGNEWKKLRNIRNRFIKNHNIGSVDSRKINKNDLKKIISDWCQARNKNLEGLDYNKVIDNNFKGFEHTKTLVINGVPSTITGGWMTKIGFYDALGIFNNKFEFLSEMSSIDDLTNLKKKKYKYVDFGGSGKELLGFKLKFKPEYIYKTVEFNILKK